MESVLRGAVVYLFVWVIIRIAGKRTMAEATTFDLVLLLIISETTQQAMIDSDHSVTNAFLLIITLVGIDILISLFKQRSSTLEKFMDGVPLVVLENGKLLKERMDKVRVDESDILSEARKAHGLERLDQIKYAVLERNGGISIIPYSE
ncbi:MAG TPA: YetF domain-containing protein [Planctomycetota bacterium]|nr:YetF domain-containing protein [Planctomycetota bacterium]